jgi:hypothetical protein
LILPNAYVDGWIERVCEHEGQRENTRTKHTHTLTQKRK